MEVLGEQVTGDRWSRSRRMGGSEWRRIDRGPPTTPPLDWTLIYNRDSAEGSGGTAGGGSAASSARKLAARLWELAVTTRCGGGVRWQYGINNELGFESSSPVTKFATQKFTKWDINNYSKASPYANHSHCYIKHPSPKSQRTRPKHVVQKLDKEETCSPMKTQQVCTMIRNLKEDVRRERKTCKKIYIENSKLQSDMVEVKSLARRITRNYEKEKKARELLQDICNEQAKSIEAYKAELEELKDRCARIQYEVEEEKEMLQVADSWREEGVQMKLVDAKFILEDKYREMNDIIKDLKKFLRSSNFVTPGNKISNNIRGVDELLYRISKFDKEIRTIKD